MTTHEQDEERGWLTKDEEAVFNELRRTVPYFKKRGIKQLAVYPKQLTMFKRICRKARKHPTFEYGPMVNPDKQTFLGVQIVSIETASRHKKKDLMPLNFDGERT